MTQRHWTIAAFVFGLALMAGAVLLVLRGGSERAGGEPPDGAGADLIVELLREPLDVAPFTMTDLEGRTMSSTGLRGKVVLVNFWATWCPPCLAEIPDLIALQEKYRDELVVIGVSEDELPPDLVRKFATNRKINYPIVMVTPELQQVFPGVVALPTTFIIDREGRVAKKQVGLLKADQTEAITRSLAGLSVNARVVRVDDPGRLSVENAAQVKDVPGVDLSRLSPERRVEVLQALNAQKFTCGCDLSVAKCRIDDPSCEFSLPLARAIAEKYVGAP